MSVEKIARFYQQNLAEVLTIEGEICGLPFKLQKAKFALQISVERLIRLISADDKNSVVYDGREYRLIDIPSGGKRLVILDTNPGRELSAEGETE